jgi:serine/threonine protein kinase
MHRRLRLDDLYAKGKLLGAGQFGTVHMATEKKTGMIVAIKTIKYVCLFQINIQRC